MKQIEKYFSGIAIILLASLFLTSSCNKDKIEDLCAEEYLGEVYLLESSRNSIPYIENTSLYFQDSLGNETVFQVNMDDQGYRIVNGSYNFQCEFDSSREKVYKVRSDEYVYNIMESEQTLNKKFRLSLHTEPSFYPYPFSIDTIYDQLSVYVRSKTDSSAYASNLYILVNPRNLSEDDINKFPSPVDKIILLDRTFNNVYISADSNEYYSFEKGLIGFRDWDKKLWVLDRTEKNIK